MRGKHDRLRKWPAAVLSLLVLAGCGGGGGESAAGGAIAPESDPRTTPDPAAEPSTDPVETAVRDLGLLDAARGTRIDTASAGFGDLSVAQFEVALMDSDPAVRQAAIDALVGVPDSILIPRLEQLEYALSDPDEAVRETVVEALGHSADPRVIALLLQARGDASDIVREEALEALSALRAVGADPASSNESHEKFPDQGD